MSQSYTPYTPSVETPQPDESQTFDQLAEVNHQISEVMLERFRHAFRTVHAKSHGILKGVFKINDNLPESLRQGLFAFAASYPVMIRFSTNPGDILDDTVSVPRGIAVKVLGVPGEMLPSNQGNVTQDFVFASGKTFAAPDAKAFMKSQKMFLDHANDSDAVKKAVSGAARATNAVLGLVGAKSATLTGMGYPPNNIIGETFGSQTAFRYGSYIAKFVIEPLSESTKALAKQRLDIVGHPSAIRDAVVDFFKTKGETAVWQVAVQLCAGLEKMPVEDPTVEWPEDLSPYQPVATITAGPQDPNSPARRVYGDEVLFFTPWHALAAHQPLGNINRARLKSYQVSSTFRHKQNDRKMIEPRDVSELPDD